MTATVAAPTRGRVRRSASYLALAVVGLAALELSLGSVGGFPESLDIGLAETVNEARNWVVTNQNDHWLFALVFNPLRDSIDWFIRLVEDWLLAVPWFVTVAAVTLVVGKALGMRASVLGLLGVLYFGLVGLWVESVQTFALMAVSVLISLLLGVPLGIWSARSDRADRAMRPVLDAMQTLPAFVYLIPVVLFFGIARVPSVVATVVYALPPVVRLTNLGIRQVPGEALEAAAMFGSTRRQTLTKVQLPLALPTILAGINQTIMMALSIVVIAALIGAGGLGQEVLDALRNRQVGRALEAGLAIVVLAMLLDRITHGFAGLAERRGSRFRLLPDLWTEYAAAQRFESAVARLALQVRSVSGRIVDPFAAAAARFRVVGERGSSWLSTNAATVVAVAALALATVAGIAAGWQQFPTWLSVSFADWADAAVDWARDNLYEIGGTGLGTGPLSDFVTTWIVKPLREWLATGVAWPVMIVAAVLLGWQAAGPGVAAFAAASLAGIGFLGMWELAMDTLAQVLVAVAISLMIGIPLGVWAARSDLGERMLRPVLDFLQTIPSFVLLVPVIILFNVGRIPGIIASVLYALPPVVRLTSLGIREVSAAATEASRSFGATPRQTLTKVQVPLAMPSIMAGINQTVLLVLAMVVIAGLVGGGGLGLEAVRGLARADTGLGFEAGISIVLLAMVLDRITQGWADRLLPPGGT